MMCARANFGISLPRFWLLILSSVFLPIKFSSLDGQRSRLIISHSLYISYPIFYNQERFILQTIYKHGNVGLKSAIKDQERVIMARGWCIIGNFMSKPFCTLVASNGIISVKHFFTETSTLLTTRMQNGFEFTWHGIILTKLDRL